MGVSLSAVAQRAPAGVRVANEGTARLDMRAVQTARATLGIASPVLITWTNGRGGRGKIGMHTRGPDGTHDIRLVRGQSAESVSRTLWHELEHARQSERMGEALFTRAYALDPWSFEAAAKVREREHDSLSLVL